MVPELSKIDLQTPRTQTDLRAWVERVHHQLGRTREGNRALRLNEGDLVKKFMEEIWPLALFADAFYMGNKDVLLKPVLGRQSYDALILEAHSCNIIHHIQITQSLDGHQNRLRMEHLEEHGRAPLTGVTLQKNPVSRRVSETYPEAVAHDRLLEQTFEHIDNAVRRKSQMRYESDTSLIVEFEDDFIGSESDCLALDRFARSSAVPAAANFAALYLVSDRRRLAFSYKTGAAS